jgi:excisionase family DNA binding protein
MDIATPVSPQHRTEPLALLKPQEVADLLAVSPRTVRRLAEEGVLERVRIGHRTSRYTRRSVLAFTDPQTNGSPVAADATRLPATLAGLGHGASTA